MKMLIRAASIAAHCAMDGSKTNRRENYYYPFVDQEFSNSNWVTTFLLNGPSAGPYVFQNGNIDTRNSGPYVIQDNGGVGSIFIGTIFNNFGASVAAPEIIDYTNGSPSTPTQLIDVGNAGGVPLSNQAAIPTSSRSGCLTIRSCNRSN